MSWALAPDKQKCRLTLYFPQPVQLYNPYCIYVPVSASAALPLFLTGHSRKPTPYVTGGNRPHGLARVKNRCTTRLPSAQKTKGAEAPSARYPICLIHFRRRYLYLHAFGAVDVVDGIENGRLAQRRSAQDSVRVVRRNGAAGPAFPVALAICSGRIKLLISISQCNCTPLSTCSFKKQRIDNPTSIYVYALSPAFSCVVIGTFVETRMLEG